MNRQDSPVAVNGAREIFVQLKKGIVMYSGSKERLPQSELLSPYCESALARVMHEHLATVYGKTLEDFKCDLQARRELSTPFFVAYGKGGWPTGAAFPIRKNHLPKDSAEVASEEYWAKDEPDGKYLVFRKLVSDFDWTPGLGKQLLQGGILPYGRAFFLHGEIEGAFAYVYPSRYGAYKGMPIEKYLLGGSDRNFALHSDLGATLGRIFPGACNDVGRTGGMIFEMDYSALLAFKA